MYFHTNQAFKCKSHAIPYETVLKHLHFNTAKDFLTKLVVIHIVCMHASRTKSSRTHVWYYMNERLCMFVLTHWMFEQYYHFYYLLAFNLHCFYVIAFLALILSVSTTKESYLHILGVKRKGFEHCTMYILYNDTYLYFAIITD